MREASPEYSLDGWQEQLRSVLTDAWHQEGTELFWSLALASQLLREQLDVADNQCLRKKLDSVDCMLVARMHSNSPAKDLIPSLVELAESCGTPGDHKSKR